MLNVRGLNHTKEELLEETCCIIVEDEYNEKDAYVVSENVNEKVILISLTDGVSYAFNRDETVSDFLKSTNLRLLKVLTRFEQYTLNLELHSY